MSFYHALPSSLLALLQASRYSIASESIYDRLHGIFRLDALVLEARVHPTRGLLSPTEILSSVD